MEDKDGGRARTEEAFSTEVDGEEEQARSGDETNKEEDEDDEEIEEEEEEDEEEDEDEDDDDNNEEEEFECYPPGMKVQVRYGRGKIKKCMKLV